MAAASDLIAKAKAELGTKEFPHGSNKVKYNTAYYGKEVSGEAYPWCCAFIWWLFKECSASPLFYGGQKTASCTSLMNYYKQAGQFSKIPRPGALVFYNWNAGYVAQHMGIVTGLGPGYVKAIEGNTAIGNDSNGGSVMERIRFSGSILGYAYPYSDNKTIGGDTVNITLRTLKINSTGNNVTALQILLNGRGYPCGTADGKFGPKTLAAVKKYQQASGLSPDGIVGAKTWDKLLGG